jgi:hypothetical protein
VPGACWAKSRLDRRPAGPYPPMVRAAPPGARCASGDNTTAGPFTPMVTSGGRARAGGSRMAMVELYPDRPRPRTDGKCICGAGGGAAALVPAPPPPEKRAMCRAACLRRICRRMQPCNVTTTDTARGSVLPPMSAGSMVPRLEHFAVTWTHYPQRDRRKPYAAAALRRQATGSEPV